MIEVEILIPVADNGGHLFTASDFEVWHTKLLDLFEGFSKRPGHIHGGWVEEGKRYDDKLLAYVVSIGNITEGGKVGEAVIFAKRHFRQRAIYISYLGLSAIL